MTDDNQEPIHRSGDVFRDFGDANADLDQARAMLAARIIKTLDARRLTVRAAEAATGIAAAEFSRIRNVKLERFTLDRLIKILGKLDDEVEIRIDFRPRRRGAESGVLA